METAIIALTGLLTEWHETCALGEPSLFPEEWLTGFQSPSAQCDRLRQQWAQEDWPQEVEVIWAIIPCSSCWASGGALVVHAVQATLPIQSHHPHRAVAGLPVGFYFSRASWNL